MSITILTKHILPQSTKNKPQQQKKTDESVSRKNRRTKNKLT